MHLMTVAELERHAMKALSPDRVRYLPASFNKRFGRDMAALAEKEEYSLTDRQRWLIWRMVYRYRKQIASVTLLAEAIKHENDPKPPSAKADDKTPRPAKPFSNKPKRLDPPKWLRRR